MKRKRALSLLLAFLVSLNLSGCKNVIQKLEEDTTEKDFEDFIDIETLEKFRKEILDSIAQSEENIEKTYGEIKDEVSSEIDDTKNEIDKKIESMKEEIKEEIKSELKEEQSSETVEMIELRNFAYLNTDSIVYESIETRKEVDYLTSYQKVFRLISFDNGYDLVEYYIKDNACIGFVSSVNLTDLPELFVEVDLTNQIVRLIKDNEVAYQNSIVSGKPSSPTRVGYFNIDSRETSRYLTGPGYRSYVNYWMPFDGDIGLHDADGWRTSSEYGGETYLTNGSHGCVNMPNDAAKYLYENVSTGDMVLVHK